MLALTSTAARAASAEDGGVAATAVSAALSPRSPLDASGSVAVFDPVDAEGPGIGTLGDALSRSGSAVETLAVGVAD